MSNGYEGSEEERNDLIGEVSDKETQIIELQAQINGQNERIKELEEELRLMRSNIKDVIYDLEQI
ncbi:MAG: hypothetical protein ACXADF_14525 [Candidatus Thorarchaeota archaeon]|jgi:chromosome segregation ATPase